MKDGKLGIYVYPEAVASAPDYAKRLVQEAGLDYFILRAGYGLDFPDEVGQAVEAVRKLNAKVCMMMGSWWGKGNIKMLDNLPSKSYESRYPMEMPGSAIDAEIIAKYENACKKFQPDSVCVSHGRYRHPGYLDGIFEEGLNDPEYSKRMAAAGIPKEELRAAKASWEKAMGKTDKDTLLKYADKGMIDFLCELAQNDAFKRFVAFRRQTISRSFRAMSKAVKSHGTSFGSNAYSLIAVDVTGQNYDDFAETCDFVQPLFPYMEYHHFEPVAAWGRYIFQHAKIDEASAIEAAKKLMKLGGAVCPDAFKALDTCGEGDGKTIQSIVSKELKLHAPYLSKPYKLQPVLRGIQWDRAAVDSLLAEAKSLGYDSFIFMGCEYLMKAPAPSAQWF